jgi:hypothetical protein
MGFCLMAYKRYNKLKQTDSISTTINTMGKYHLNMRIFLGLFLQAVEKVMSFHTVIFKHSA